MSEQQSPEWWAARLGCVTASRVADVIAKTKTGYSTSRANYAAQLVAERLTGNVAPSYTNAAMEWGVLTEAEARAAYSFYADTTVEECGFIPHPAIAMTGASPDGLVGCDGLVEIKCPQTAGHIETILGAGIAAKYGTQMQWQMACTGRAWCDFASFDPRMPERMRLFVQRVVRDDKMIGDLEREVAAFLAEVGKSVASLEAAFAQRSEAA